MGVRIRVSIQFASFMAIAFGKIGKLHVFLYPPLFFKEELSDIDSD